MSKKSRAGLKGTVRNVPIPPSPLDTIRRDGIAALHDFDAAPLPEGWGDHPQTFIGPVRGVTQQCVEFRFEDSTKKELREALARLRDADEAARAAFVGDLECALTGYIAFERVEERAEHERDGNQSLVKELHKRLGAVLVPLRKAISPERRAPLPVMDLNGSRAVEVVIDSNNEKSARLLHLNPEFVKGVIEHLEWLHQNFTRVLEAEARRKRASKNQGGRPREESRRRFIQQAVGNYKTRFGEWPRVWIGSPFLRVLLIALTAAGFPYVVLYNELGEVVRELKGSSAAL